MWASGNQECRGQIGNLTAKAINIMVNTRLAGSRIPPLEMASGSSVISKVSNEKNNTSIPTSMNALPRSVKIKNFIAEYSLFGLLPHIEIRKNIGISSSSQNMKNKKKSMEVNTPMTADWRINSHMKYSGSRSLTLHEANTDTMPNMPVKRTIGALSPSMARKYCTLNDSTGIQSSILSTSWN